MKRIRRDLSKAPASRRAVHSCADLHDLTADLPAGLALFVAADWIDPPDAPRLNSGIPDAQGGPKHVVRPVGIGLAVRRARHDPDVLYRPPFENPTEVRFALDLLG